MVDFVQGARKIKLTGDDPDNFVKVRLIDKDYPSVGRLTAADMEQLKTSLDFVSNDDLRPAMTGVFFEMKGIDKKSRLVTTDAHRLFWHPLEGTLEKEFILPQKTARILLALGGEWDISCDTGPDKDNENYIRFTREDDAKVISRVIDARFPDYKAVLPEGRGLVKLIATPEFLLKEFKNAGKFANKSTNQVTLGLNGLFSMSSQEVDFGEEYRSEFQNKQEVEFGFSKNYPKQYTLKGEDRFSQAIQVSKADLVEQPPSLYIGFNAKFMQEIIEKTPKDSPVTIEMWSPTKCAIINKNFLLMPLMLSGS